MSSLNLISEKKPNLIPRLNCNQADTNGRQTSKVVSSGAPKRAHETGVCPTCNRQFGIKSYDRHVEWCRERSSRFPSNIATNVAKERLQARIGYRAPILRNRKPTNRDKYSPGFATNLSLGTKASSLQNACKSAESAVCNKDSDAAIKRKANNIA